MELNRLFADHMVFQAGKPVRVFGTGAGTARVSFLGETGEAVSAGGDWLIELGCFPYGGPYELCVELNGGTTVIHDVYVGEVLLCAGQSNVTFLMRDEVTPKEAYEDDPLLRGFRVSTPEPAPDALPPFEWTTCRRDNVDRWSALGWLIGVRVRKRTGAAVGIIVCAQGASVIQSWIGEAYLQDERLYVPPEELHFDHTYPTYAVFNPFSCLYHCSFEKIVPYSFGSVVWYQGESNTSVAESRIYLLLFETMLKCWREADRDARLHFTVIQIADFKKDEGWVTVQQKQTEAASLPDVSVVRCGDICESDMIHPVTKGPLAERVVNQLPLFGNDR